VWRKILGFEVQKDHVFFFWIHILNLANELWRRWYSVEKTECSLSFLCPGEFYEQAKPQVIYLIVKAPPLVSPYESIQVLI
jgi:hypothetical protein